MDKENCIVNGHGQHHYGHWMGTNTKIIVHAHALPNLKIIFTQKQQQNMQ